MSFHHQKTQNKEKKAPTGRGVKGVAHFNLVIRFLLELAALITLGLWGWRQGGEVWHKYTFALGIPIIAAAIWGIFNVPNDTSRSGVAPIVVPGITRLAIELAIFSLATWALHDLTYIGLSWLLGSIVILHYLVSYDRIIWLIKH